MKKVTAGRLVLAALTGLVAPFFSLISMGARLGGPVGGFTGAAITFGIAMSGLTALALGSGGLVPLVVVGLALAKGIFNVADTLINKREHTMKGETINLQTKNLESGFSVNKGKVGIRQPVTPTVSTVEKQQPASTSPNPAADPNADNVKNDLVKKVEAHAQGGANNPAAAAEHKVSDHPLGPTLGH